MRTGAIAPGGTVGILGGGQLGRMLALAAARLGLRTHVYAPPGDNPAFDVAHARTEASWDDEAALYAFAGAVDVITYEFENIPARTVHRLAGSRPLAPHVRALEIAQDRLDEKRFVADLGLETAPFAAVGDPVELGAAIGAVGLPAVLKTRRMGYDGKGQVVLHPGEAALDGWERLGRVPCILEGFVRFDYEISVVAARNAQGQFVAFDIPRNTHENGILRRSRVPAGLSPAAATRAVEMAERIMDALGYVGVLAVEMFVVGDAAGGGERLLINELAPRVHNSGHWTEAACTVSQFEQHIRAICGWPLAKPMRLADCEMTNLLGEEVNAWREIATEPGAVLHIYGKREVRSGRKMGHVTRLRPFRE